MGSIAAQSWCEFPPGRHFGAQWTGPCPAPIITFRLATTSAPRRRRADLPTGVHNHISTAGAALDPSMTHLPPRPSLSAPLGRYMYIYRRSTFASSTFTNIVAAVGGPVPPPLPPLLLWTKARRLPLPLPLCPLLICPFPFCSPFLGVVIIRAQVSTRVCKA